MYCDPSVTFTDFPGEPPSDDNDELSDQITYMAAQLNAGNYRFLKLLGVFDSRDGWGAAGIMSCVHWLLPMVGRGNAACLLVLLGQKYGWPVACKTTYR